MSSSTPRIADHVAEETFRRALEEFQALGPAKRGSVTIHFTEGPEVRKVEWSLHEDRRSPDGGA